MDGLSSLRVSRARRQVDWRCREEGIETLHYPNVYVQKGGHTGQTIFRPHTLKHFCQFVQFD